MLLAQVALIAVTSLTVAPEAGDRHPDRNCVFPADAYLHNGGGGRVIDVTRAPFHAKGDGVTDDTAALVKAYDFVLAEMDKYRWDASGVLSPRCEYIIYLPNGTYLVSDTVIYSGPWRSYPGNEAPRRGKRVFERLVKIRFFGQERDKTVIRLKDDSPGFDGDPRPVLSFGKCDLNNAVAYNAVRNLTIDTGRDNPGAVGLDFCGANNSGIHNVSILSEDGQGAAGIHFRICPAMGFHDDITVRGFDHGLLMTPYHMTHNSFEYVTLEGQNRSGVGIGDCSASIRKLRSENRVPAVELTSGAGQLVLIDSELQGLDAKQPAIDAPIGYVFVRDVQTPGYACPLRVGDREPISGNVVDEYVTSPVLSLREGQTPRSLRLPIEDSPEIAWETDMSRWANVDDFGAKGDGETDDSAAVQAAMDSGKPVVYFPKAAYRMRAPVLVPATVERVVGFYGAPSGALHIEEDGPRPLLIEDFGTDSHLLIRHRAPRTLVMSHIRASYFNETKSPDVKVFINNCNSLGKNRRAFEGGRYWVRFMNTEFKTRPNFTCNGGDMWVLGYKVEGHMTNFESINGGRLEVLGGICNEHGEQAEPDTPVLRNVDSSLCFIGYTNGPNRFETIVEETIDGETKRLTADDCPDRVAPGGYTRWDDRVVPMYVSGERSP